MSEQGLADDVMVALAHLADRAGARQLEIGFDDATQPPTWWASVHYQGTRFMVQGHPTPSGAALGMAEELLSKSRCRCGRWVTLQGGVPGQCRWRLMGDRWQSTCDAPPVEVHGARGDLGAMQESMNRADRRRAARRDRHRG